MSDGDKGEAAEGIKIYAKRLIVTNTYTEAEVQAMIAAAVMEAAYIADRFNEEALEWAKGNGIVVSGKTDSTRISEAIRALITPDAKAALDAYRDREVRKAEHLAYVRGLENSLAMVRSMRASDGLLRGQELICSGLEINLTKARALIPEVKP